MSDILVRCRHCGILKAPRDICVCRLGEPSRPGPKRAMRVGLDIPLGPPPPVGGLFCGRSLGAVVSSLPQNVRYSLAGVGLVAAALLALAISGTRGETTDEVQARAESTVVVTVTVPALAYGPGSAPRCAPVQLASGETAQVVWISEEVPPAYATPVFAPSAMQSSAARRKSGTSAPTIAQTPDPGSPIFLDGSAPPGKSAGDSHPRAKQAEPRTVRANRPDTCETRAEKARTECSKPSVAAAFMDLGTLGGEESVAYDINDAGQVVGKSQTVWGEWHAFLWQDGSMRDLGSLGGESCACAINEDGQIAGYSYLKGSRGACRAVRWSPAGEMTTLGPLERWVEFRGGAIGETGIVVGWAAGEDTSQSAAIMWARDKAVPLPSDSASAAYDINPKGLIVGYQGFEGRRTAVIWRIGAKPTRLPNVGEGWSEARAINAYGHVVGFRQPTGGRARAFVSRGGKLEELKNLAGYTMSVAQGINDLDQVVGYVWRGKDTERQERAFVWRNGSMADLNMLVGGSAAIEKARRINNRGQIAAVARVGGKTRACLIELN